MGPGNSYQYCGGRWNTKTKTVTIEDVFTARVATVTPGIHFCFRLDLWCENRDYKPLVP